MPRSQKRWDKIKDGVIFNFSYKMVAFFIALILWLSILGRRDFIVTKTVDVNFLTAQGYVVTGQSADSIQLKLSGPQPLLRKFNEKKQTLDVDILDKKSGLHEVDILANKIETPLGIKVLSIRPNVIRVEVSEDKKQQPQSSLNSQSSTQPQPQPQESQQQEQSH